MSDQPSLEPNGHKSGKAKLVVQFVGITAVFAVATLAVIFAQLVFGTFAVLMISTDFNPMGDWEYTDLPNGYYISRSNSSTIDVCIHGRRIAMTDRNGSTNIRLGTYVSSFCSNDRYIAVRWIDLAGVETNDNGLYERETIRAHCDEAVWYLIDTTDDALYGPYETQTAFAAACVEHSVGALGPWIDTYPRPEGAK